MVQLSRAAPSKKMIQVQPNVSSPKVPQAETNYHKSDHPHDKPRVIKIAGEVGAAKLPASRPLVPFKEINRNLLVTRESARIGSGTFGNCYLALHRGEFEVAVKEIKQSKHISAKEAKSEVIREARVLSTLGDHAGLPHLFGVCTSQPPYCLILQFHKIDCHSVTLHEAAATILKNNLLDSVSMFRSVCDALSYIHSQGFLHNDLKGNNVVLEKRNEGYHPIIIDFGKSIKLCKVRLRKPKVNVDTAIQRFPHIAPEVHRGERQSTSSDVYSFGHMLACFQKKGELNNSILCSIAHKCTSSNRTKRPSLQEVDAVLSNLV